MWRILYKDKQKDQFALHDVLARAGVDLLRLVSEC